ncbi:phosphotransferase [Kitasatospora sp. NPDC094019]|uniref:phosphotransferase n=1 Tax=Kitasatospora sp. NPDC094019 TaxID=3364091 RepID=UPI00380B149D
MSYWEFVKARTATEGAVWRSTDGLLYKRTGGEDLRAEGEFQQLAAGSGYPVPEIVGTGWEDGEHFVVERSLGASSLHEEALADVRRDGQISSGTLSAASAVASCLLRAQARHPLPATPWFGKAAFAAEVFEENPDFETPRVHEAVERALDRLARLPMVHGHLDYGLPNVLRGGVIDWQHHGPVPLGYDVCPALDIVAFRGRGQGSYRITPEQRAAYLDALDETAAALIGLPVSEHLGDFLLVKCFFFLARMRPTDPARQDKYIKWQYRRALFARGLDQYESGGAIDTGAFPALDRFAAEHR